MSCGPCDPEMVFELADGQLEGREARLMRLHLEECPGCRGLYGREVALNERLDRAGGELAPGCSVSQMVAMALPTRTARSRAVWALLAAALSLSALLALEISGGSLAIALLDASTWVSGAFSGLWDLAEILFAVAGRWVVIALLFGIAFDLALLAVVVAVFARGDRRTREA